MKKITSLLLAVILAFTACTTAFAIESYPQDEITEYPLIIVPGYSASDMIDAETGEQVWHIQGDNISSAVLDNIIEIGKGLGELTVGNANRLADILSEGIIYFIEKLRCNPDGTSVYNIQRSVSTAVETNSANLAALYPDGKYQHERDMAADFAKYIGYENIFNFTCDFRMGAEECADRLDELIQDVKAYTHKDKVNLVAVSHGGQVTATYLALYGYKNDVDNAVLTVPAIGGAGIASDSLLREFDFDEDCLLRFIQHGNRLEEDYDWLMKAQWLGILDDICCRIVDNIFDYIGYWGSLWDFMTIDKYEHAKEELLDPQKSALLIEKSDRFHYEILPSIPEKLAECQKNGMNISIIAGCGNPVVTGMYENSDAIITTNASTGAKTAPYMQKFGRGYVQQNPCGGKNKISPDMTIDASTAYLPDNTWFINGLFHGMTYWDTHVRSLLMTLLFTDRITDVYSDPAYPQFKDTVNPSSAVYTEFTDCQPGIIGDTQSITVTNCCWQNDLRLTAISCDGMDISFKVDPTVKLAPGESIEIPFSGNVPELSGQTASVTVYYVMKTITPIGYRTQDFTINNGNRVEQTEDFESAAPNNPFKGACGDIITKVLKKFGLFELVTMLCNIACYWVKPVIVK